MEIKDAEFIFGLTAQQIINGSFFLMALAIGWVGFSSIKRERARTDILEENHLENKKEIEEVKLAKQECLDGMKSLEKQLELCNKRLINA